MSPNTIPKATKAPAALARWYWDAGGDAMLYVQSTAQQLQSAKLLHDQLLCVNAWSAQEECALSPFADMLLPTPRWSFTGTELVHDRMYRGALDINRRRCSKTIELVEAQ